MADVNGGTPGESVVSVPVVNTSEWSEPWRTLVGGPLNILIVVVVCLVARWLAHRLIDRLAKQAMTRHESRLIAMTGVAGQVFADATGLSSERHHLRAATTASLMKSVTTVVIFSVGVLTVLSIIGIPLGPLLASAGVGGIALGFGAQSLVKDFLAGIALIAEDQFGVGDVVDTGPATGTVEEVGLRITRLRDGDGVVWYVRNGEILRVGNRSQGFSVAVVDVQVSYREDIAKVTGVIRDAIAPLRTTEPWSGVLLDDPQVGGIESLTGGLVTLRLTAKCRANEKDGVAREMRERVKVAFDANGITLPVPPTLPMPSSQTS